MASKYVHARCGDDLLSVAVEAPAAAQALAAQLRQADVWLEVVPGIDSVVVRFDAAVLDVLDAERCLEETLGRDAAPLAMPDDLVEIAVSYGGESGPDLDAVCERLGLSVDEFVAIHTGREYRAEMVGFTPGFVFVGGLDDRLNVPRRDEPRQWVPAGSVAIADERTGLYALASPGGWNLVGRTEFPLFDRDAEDPFPIRPGTRIRFRSLEAKQQ